MTKQKIKNDKKRPAKAVVMDLPEFKSEREEADFWDASPYLITAVMRAVYSPQCGKTRAKVLLHEAMERAISL